MIYLCPHCGRPLGRTLREGLTTCENCWQVFEATYQNTVMAAAWVAKREKVWDPELLEIKCGISSTDAVRIVEYITEKAYSHEEFIKLMVESKV